MVLPRTGKVVTFTVVRVPPAGFTEQTPLPIAVVELDNGVRVMVQIADVGTRPHCGSGCRCGSSSGASSWDGEAGVIFYGHKAVPAL